MWKAIGMKFRCKLHLSVPVLEMLQEAMLFGRISALLLIVPNPCNNRCPGSMIVNIGDMLQEMTNGQYKATTHRVLTHCTATLTCIALRTAP